LREELRVLRSQK